MTGYLAYVAKAAIGFLALLATNVAVDLTAKNDPWPQTSAEWWRWGLTTVLGTWLVYRVPNGPKPAPPDPDKPAAPFRSREVAPPLRRRRVKPVPPAEPAGP